VKSSNYSHLEELIKAGKRREGWNSLGSARFTARVESVSPAGKDGRQRKDPAGGTDPGQGQP